MANHKCDIFVRVSFVLFAGRERRTRGNLLRPTGSEIVRKFRRKRRAARSNISISESLALPAISAPANVRCMI